MSEESDRKSMNKRTAEPENAASDNHNSIKALRECQKKLETLTQNISDIIWTVDLNLRTTYVSPSIENILGFTPEERAVHSPEEMITPGSLESIRNLIKQEFSKDTLNRNDPSTSLIIMTEYYRKDGSTIWLEDNVNWILDDNDAITGIHGISRDITEHRKVLEALNESKQQYRELVNNLGEGISIVDSEENFIFANPAAHDIFGVPHDSLIGRNMKEFLDEEGIAFILSKSEKHRDGKPDSYELRIIRPDGQERHLLVTIRPKLDPHLSGMFGIFRDITDRKRMEEAVTSSLSLLTATLESTTDGILVIRNDGKIARWNRKFADMWKLKEDVLNTYENSKYIEAVLTKLCDPDLFLRKVEVLRNNPETTSFDMLELLDGRMFERYSQPQRIGNEIVGRVWSFRDVTKRIQVEKEKDKLVNQLNQAQKMESIGRLAGGVAHDFNNMLSVILGHLEILRANPSLDSEALNGLKEIQNAADRSTNLVRQLLAFARKQTISPEILNLNETVENMHRMLLHMIGEDINLSWEPGKNLWLVNVDPIQIDQILANFCVNARDAIVGVGNVTIETENVCIDDMFCAEHNGAVPGEYVLLSVRDDGCGMDEEIRNNIFEPFFTTKESGKGTGLGLSMIYGIVKQNNGYISVHSEPGQGTCFSVYLPRYFRKPVLSLRKDPLEQAAGGSETILLVDDESTLLEITGSMLELMGYTVISASTPDKAIRMAEEHAGEISLLLTDVVMPDMNGLDLANELQKTRPNLKFLFMSGYMENVIAHQGVLDEGVLFIHKPFSSNELGVKIRKALDRADTPISF